MLDGDVKPEGRCLYALDVIWKLCGIACFGHFSEIRSVFSLTVLVQAVSGRSFSGP